MNHWNLTPNIKRIRVKVDGTNYAGAAGLTDLTSEVIDTIGYLGGCFIMSLGAIVTGAVTSIKIQHGNASDGSDMADIAGSNQVITDAADNKLVIAEFYRPYKRYLRVFTDRGTQNATIDNLMVELYGPSDAPVQQDASVASYEFFNGSAEGVA